MHSITAVRIFPEVNAHADSVKKKRPAVGSLKNRDTENVSAVTVVAEKLHLIEGPGGSANVQVEYRQDLADLLKLVIHNVYSQPAFHPQNLDWLSRDMPTSPHNDKSIPVAN